MGTWSVSLQYRDLRTRELTITYLAMTISTKTNSTTLSHLSIITNKTVEMIAMKIFRFVEVATLSHRQEETDGFFKVLRGDRGHLSE